MPRNGSGIYSIPLGTDGFPDQTIESTKYNNCTHDFEQDANLPRPIVAGGTGAVNAHDALTNLGGEFANQVVTNYDSFPFSPGSFYSLAGATSEPVAGHIFTGICMAQVGSDLILEGRDISDATMPTYVRHKAGGVWQPWVKEAASDKVAKAGDTMSGDLTIDKTNPQLVLRKAASTQQNTIIGYTSTHPRWAIVPGDSAPESGADAGSNFVIARFSDANTNLGNPLVISRNTGNIGINSTTPQAALTLVGNSLFADTTLASSLVGVSARQNDIVTLNMNSSPSAVVLLGRDTVMTTSGAGNMTGGGHAVALKAECSHGGTGTFQFMIGVEGSVGNTSTGTLTDAYAMMGYFNGNTAGKTIANYYAFKSQSAQNNSGIINRWADFYSENLGAGGSGTINNRYSLLNEDPLKLISTAGDITIAKDTPTLNLNSATDSPGLIYFNRGGLARWSLFKQSGADDLGFGRFNDAGGFLDAPLSIIRSTGLVNILNLNVGTSTAPSTSGTIKTAYPGSGISAMSMRPAANATTNVMVFESAAAAVIGSITQTTVAVAYNTSSSAELKEDLKSFDAGRIVDDTNVYNFAWKQSPKQIAAGEPVERAYGVLAQQAQEVYPAAVTYDKPNDWWGVDYSKYVPILLQELKALRARVAQLEAGPASKPA